MKIRVDVLFARTEHSERSNECAGNTIGGGYKVGYLHIETRMTQRERERVRVKAKAIENGDRKERLIWRQMRAKTIRKRERQ